jgi:haloalkane dehalogenase
VPRRSALPAARRPAAYGEWLQRTPLPKLLIHADPGVLVPAPVADWARAHLPNLATVDVGPGIHYLQEDQPHAIGTAIAGWLRGLER